MSEVYRKITVHFITEADLDLFSDKILKGTDYKLLPNMKSVYFHQSGIDFEYTKKIKKLSAPIKEWEKHWKNLTPFTGGIKEPFAKINLYFNKEYDNAKLAELFQQTFTVKTKSIYFPSTDGQTYENNKRIIGSRGNPQYPIYIISKGRSKTCVTADHLIKMDVPFKIVIEKQEWQDYAEVYGEDRLLELDLSFRDGYDTYIKDFDNSKSKGSGPARNFVWWHSKNVMGADWHWIIDDNIYGFCYYINNARVKAVDGTLFASAEDFVNRYNNIGIAGLNYYTFVIPGTKDRPYVANTKNYSCLLIRNEIPIRWAGRYNEDVDICIRALKEGYSTIQFDAYISKKANTQTMSGGNTDAFYAEEGTLPKSNMLMHNHPDITRVMWRFQRWHHITNYDIFDVYKDRKISDVIIELMKAPVLDRVKDANAIQDIMALDLHWIKKWDILEYLPAEKRNEVLKVLKFYRYTKDNERIVNILCMPKVLDCNYYDYVWESKIPDTEDNKIMKDLLALGDEDGFLFNSVDWGSYLDYVQPEKRQKIAHEMERNKYLMKKDTKNYTYDLKEFLIDEEDHAGHHDSKARILNKFVNKNNDLVEPVTLHDQKMRNEIKVKNKSKFQSKLTSRHSKVVKNHEEYTVLIHGSEDFENEKLFSTEINKIIHENVGEIINSVNYPVDLMAANYALDNKLMNREFVPDDIMYTTGAYRKIYEDMEQYSNECVLFIQSTISDDLQYLIDLFNKSNKKISIIKNLSNITLLDEWD